MKLKTEQNISVVHWRKKAMENIKEKIEIIEILITASQEFQRHEQRLDVYPIF